MRYEYKQLKIASGNMLTEDAMNKFGADGWELVGFTFASGCFCYVFKKAF